MALKSCHFTSEQMINTVCELGHQLQEWRASLPYFCQPDAPLQAASLPPNVPIYQILYLFYSYHGSLTAIHSIFFHPWNSNLLGPPVSHTPQLRAQIALSTSIIVDASRKMIHDMEHISIDASTPKWLVFIFPLIALINVFIFVLQDPTLPSTQSDISLMDVVAGHFNYLEFASVDMAFPFTREVSNLARLVALKARGRSYFDKASMMGHQNVERSGMMADPTSDLERIDISDFDVERWSTHLPWPVSTSSLLLETSNDNLGMDFIMVPS